MEPEKINRIKVVLVEQGKTGKWLIPQYVLLYQHQCDALNSGRNQELQEEMMDLLKQEEESKKDLLNLFRDLGYGIE